MVKGLNHLTLAVSDLERSFRFYTELLGLKPVARWMEGCYLSAGLTWICLILDPNCRRGPLAEYTHVAFTVAGEDMAEIARHLRNAGVTQWKQNRSEGESLYILDPDGHKLELHQGDLASRLAAVKEKPYAGMVFFPPT